MPVDYRALAARYGGQSARPTPTPRPASSRRPISASFDEEEDDFQAQYVERGGVVQDDAERDAYQALHGGDGAQQDAQGASTGGVDYRALAAKYGADTGVGGVGGEEEGEPSPEIDYEAEALKAIPLQLGPDGEEDIRITRQREQLARLWKDQAAAEDTGPAQIRPTPWFKRRNFGIGPVGNFDAGPSALDIARAAPDIGGAVGGIVGGAAGTAAQPGGGTLAGGLKGAALGGAGGAAVRDLALLAMGARPKAPLEAAKGIAAEAVLQPAMELGGRAIGGLAKRLGTGAVERSLNPSEALLREFPDVVEETVKHRVPVGRGYVGKAAKTKGSEIAEKKLDEASRHVDKLLDDSVSRGEAWMLASKGGSKVDRALMYVKNVAGESKAVQKLLNRPTSEGINFVKSKTTQPIIDLINDIHLDDAQFPGKFKQLEKAVDNFLKQRNGPLTARDLQDIQQRAYKIAQQIYDARTAGSSLGPRATTRAQFNESLAKGIKTGVMDRIPGVAEGQAEKQALMGVEQAVKAAELRPASRSIATDAIPAALGAAFGALQGGGGIDSTDNALLGAALSWGLTRGVLHPRQLSRTGLALTAPQTQALLKQFPRLLDVLYRTASARQHDMLEEAGFADDTFPQARAQSTLR